MKTLRYFFLIPLFLLACSDDEFKTAGQRMGEKLDYDVTSQKVSKASVYEWSDEYGYLQVINQAPFNIDGQYIAVDNRIYNLDQLVSYEIQKQTSPKVLILYFR